MNFFELLKNNPEVIPTTKGDLAKLLLPGKNYDCAVPLSMWDDIDTSKAVMLYDGNMFGELIDLYELYTNTLYKSAQFKKGKLFLFLDKVEFNEMKNGFEMPGEFNHYQMTIKGYYNMYPLQQIDIEFDILGNVFSFAWKDDNTGLNEFPAILDYIKHLGLNF
jgi:hypothetical protein